LSNSENDVDRIERFEAASRNYPKQLYLITIFTFKDKISYNYAREFTGGGFYD